jgi:ABC-2 type transport system permease protein
MGAFQRIFSKRNRALLRELVKTDFKLRYQGSAIGYLWSLFRPLFMFAILYVVFTVVFPLGKGVPHYPVYLFVGMMFWNFFSEMTQQSLGSVVGRGDLIRKIKIPRWMIVFSTSLNALINLGLNMIVLVVFMLINGVSPMPSLLLLPLVIVEVYIFGLGLSYLLSAAFVRYRDVQYIWELLIQAGFYMTPILYPLTMVTNELFQKVILLNPLAQAIQDARWAVVTHDPSVITVWNTFDGGAYTLIPFAIVAAMFVVGVLFFRSRSNSFAEDI